MRSGSGETGPEGSGPPDPLQQLALAAAVICRPKRLKFLPIPEDLPLLFSSPHDSDHNEEEEDEEVAAALISTPDTDASTEYRIGVCTHAMTSIKGKPLRSADPVTAVLRTSQ
ncbi:uncharacterized protein [Periplaneta americana]|uniref:uncharacterized protein n=1 Tax=Periplaneta americana TaxID=6978 RepID=UPI0037E7F484